jgi:chromosome segregation ATPase
MSNTKSELKAARAELGRLEAEEPKLQAILADLETKGDEVKRNFRAGKANMADVRHAEGEAAAIAAVLQQARSEIHALRDRAAILETEAEDQDLIASMQADATDFWRLQDEQDAAFNALEEAVRKAASKAEHLYRQMDQARGRLGRNAAHYVNKRVPEGTSEGDAKTIRDTAREQLMRTLTPTGKRGRLDQLDLRSWPSNHSTHPNLAQFTPRQANGAPGADPYEAEVSQ